MRFKQRYIKHLSIGLLIQLFDEGTSRSTYQSLQKLRVFFFFLILKPESGVGLNSEKPATSRAGIGQDPNHPGLLSTNKYDTYYINICVCKPFHYYVYNIFIYVCAHVWMYEMMFVSILYKWRMFYD